MQTYFNIALIVLAALLTASILMQARGSGLGGVFGGEGAVFRTKRGIEKFLFVFTIVTSCLFMAVAVANLIYAAA